MRHTVHDGQLVHVLMPGLVLFLFRGWGLLSLWANRDERKQVRYWKRTSEAEKAGQSSHAPPKVRENAHTNTQLSCCVTLVSEICVFESSGKAWTLSVCGWLSGSLSEWQSGNRAVPFLSLLTGVILGLGLRKRRWRDEEDNTSFIRH